MQPALNVLVNWTNTDGVRYVAEVWGSLCSWSAVSSPHFHYHGSMPVVSWSKSPPPIITAWRYLLI